jgi:hypothetical protein
MDQSTILNSWKEIALYIGRAVRTVQRWEGECHLPIHRPRGKKRSPVFALSSEIDRWLEDCPIGGVDRSGFNHKDEKVHLMEYRSRL